MAIRAINTAGTAPTNIIVNGVNIGDATAGYTTLAAAITAGSNGDIFVVTDAINAALSGLQYTLSLLNTRITCADNVRDTTGRYNTSKAHVAHAYAIIYSGASGTSVFENLGRSAAGSYSFDNTGAGAIVISRTKGKVVTNFPYILGRSSTSIKCDHNMVELASGTTTNACYIWNFSSGDRNVKCFNDMVVATATTTTPSYCFRGNSVTQRVDVVNCTAVKATGANTPSTYYTNCLAHASYPAGYNRSEGSDAPGTTPYNSVVGADILKDPAIASLDMHEVSRASLETYPGADVSTEVYAADLDADNESKGDEWFSSADWIAATVAAVASASSIGFFLMCPFGLLYGLQDE